MFQGFLTKPLAALTNTNPMSPGVMGQTQGNNAIAGSSAVGGGAGGGANYNIIDTLTAQQHRLADTLEGRIGAQGTPGGSLSGELNNALNNALTANPSNSISPDNTAKYIQQSVATPLLRQYDQTIMPRLKDSYASVGALLGSRRGYAQQQALTDLQNTIGTELGRAQLSNQQLSANLQEQQAQRQGSIVGQQQQMALGYNQLGAELTGQSHMAIQPMALSNLWGGNALNVNQGFSSGPSFQQNFSSQNFPQQQIQPQQNLTDPWSHFTNGSFDPTKSFGSYRA